MHLTGTPASSGGAWHGWVGSVLRQSSQRRVHAPEDLLLVRCVDEERDLGNGRAGTDVEGDLVREEVDQALDAETEHALELAEALVEASVPLHLLQLLLELLAAAEREKGDRIRRHIAQELRLERLDLSLRLGFGTAGADEPEAAALC